MAIHALPPLCFEAAQFLFFPIVAARGHSFFPETTSLAVHCLASFGTGLLGALAVNYGARRIVPLAHAFQRNVYSAVNFLWTGSTSNPEDSDEEEFVATDPFQKIAFVAVMAIALAAATWAFLPLYAGTSSFACKLLYCGVYQGLVRGACSPPRPMNASPRGDLGSFLDPAAFLTDSFENRPNNVFAPWRVASQIVHLGVFAATGNPMIATAANALFAMAERALTPVVEGNTSFETFVFG